MYRVLLERAAEKALSRLSTDVHNRVITAIQGLASNPRPSGCRKLTGSGNDWRIRVGDYRVLYEAESDETPHVFSGGNRRRDSYRSRQSHRPPPRNLPVTCTRPWM